MLDTCPTAQQLQDLTLGRLSDRDSDQLFQHVDHCEECHDRLNEQAIEDTFVEALRDGTVEESFSAEPQMRLAMAKALGALAVAEDALTEELPSAIGEYEVLRCLGRGGMGAVYLARHTKLNRSVALKVLAGHRKLDPRMHDRFQAEMRAAGRLSHPNIVAAHDAREVD
ncbi:MAG: hypothetical protein KDB14_27220, partial [Planctomycetales bacterium]|nr:hypothetical protein [Planctomycetales bacterium]